MRNSNAILSILWLSNLQGAPEAEPTTLRSQVLLAFRIQWRTSMTKVKLLSAGLFAAAMLATPAMAREGQANSRQLAMDANASAASGAFC